MTGRLHHSTEPPPHPSSVMHVDTKQLEVVIREKPVSTVQQSVKHILATILVAKKGLNG